MALRRSIITEYINQVRKDFPGACNHKRAENIVRGYDCVYLKVPRLETEPITCLLHHCETSPNCFCCWAKRRPYPKDFIRGDSFVNVTEIEDSYK